nr:immunoglobulin light chain junction region [Macaca mulatta]MOV97029.1 immunoglobulin light chain junction region [Macaca mulatta]MOV97177.1 immunoglobulin light chain junction region [Macaca mulatta]MOV97202.1 immunoglobulin light chain junction region [Macaca mulatta]MOV97612.1 immunoglobulin light chain junction region [Macaca mulatta]
DYYCLLWDINSESHIF